MLSAYQQFLIPTYHLKYVKKNNFLVYILIYKYVEINNCSLPYRGVLIRSILNRIAHIADEFRKCFLKIICEDPIYFVCVCLE